MAATKIRLPNERVTVVYPWMTSICKNNPCASAILALSIFRHNEYGWNEHYITREELKEALFNQFTMYQINKSLKQLFTDKVFTQIQRKCYDRTTVFSVNATVINKFLENYKTQYPITQKTKTEQVENLAARENTQPADSNNGSVDIAFSIKEEQKDKEDINNPVPNFEQCASQGDIVVELELALTQLLAEKSKHNDQLSQGCNFAEWVRGEEELRTALLETQQALEEAKEMKKGTVPTVEPCDELNVTPNLREVHTLEGVPVDMKTPHGPITNQLSQNFYKQQKTSSERVITGKHMQRLKHFSKKFGNSIEEMIWFLKNSYTEKGYTVDKVMGILSAIAPTFTRPNGMPV